MGTRKKKLEEPSDAYTDLPMEEVDALYESNLIENESGMIALEDAIEAWIYAKGYRESLLALPTPGRVEYILGIHKRLMKRLEPKIAGDLRDCDVWIGGDCKRFYSKIAIRDQLVSWLIDSFPEARFRKKTIEAREEMAKKWHVAFEEIHPFADGNGRTGRILYQVHRLMLGLSVKVIEAKTKHDSYYPWFREQKREEFVEKMMKGLMEEGL